MGMNPIACFKNGASKVFRIVVTNFNPNVTIPVAGRAGSAPDEAFNFLLSEITCPVGPTATAIATQPATVVVTNTPNLETRYRACFYFNPNGIVMGKNDSHVIFGASTAQGVNTLVIELRKNGSSFQIHIGLLNDRSRWSYTGWSTLPTGWSAIELDWRAATAAGTNNGGLTLWLNGTQVTNVTGIDNDLQKVDWVALGAVNEIDNEPVTLTTLTNSYRAAVITSVHSF